MSIPTIIFENNPNKGFCFQQYGGLLYKMPHTKYMQITKLAVIQFARNEIKNPAIINIIEIFLLFSLLKQSPTRNNLLFTVSVSKS